MIKSTSQEPVVTKPFHELFPFGIQWFVVNNKTNLENNAYFPYEDYRDKYAKALKSDKNTTKITKFNTEPREKNPEICPEEQPQPAVKKNVRNPTRRRQKTSQKVKKS